MSNLTISLNVRINREIETRLNRAAEERMIGSSTLARQILAHRLGLTKHDPLADGRESESCPPIQP